MASIGLQLVGHSPEEQAAMGALQVLFTKGTGYGFIQAKTPWTIGYALADSKWSPCGRAPPLADS
jgi:hypothetical protein